MSESKTPEEKIKESVKIEGFPSGVRVEILYKGKVVVKKP